MDKLITKAAKISGLELNETEMSLINKYALEPLTREEVFAFKIAICGNEIDRDSEVFPIEALYELAKLFVGKTVLKDHQFKTDNQKARIYATEVVENGAQSSTGEKYAQLVAHCYMLKSESNADLISDIRAGIKKEVSVSCQMGSVICSICGVDNRKAYCKHLGGREYDGKMCYFKLLSPTDAYEVSFVAVPAQPDAGVTKSYMGEPYKGEENNTDNNEAVDYDIEVIKSFVFTENQKNES